MIVKKTNNRIYIVICTGADTNDPYYIDSVWTSKRKAEKRADELNLGSNSDWREDRGFLNFEVVPRAVCK